MSPPCGSNRPPSSVVAIEESVAYLRDRIEQSLAIGAVEANDEGEIAGGIYLVDRAIADIVCAVEIAISALNGSAVRFQIRQLRQHLKACAVRFDLPWRAAARRAAFTRCAVDKSIRCLDHVSVRKDAVSISQLERMDVGDLVRRWIEAEHGAKAGMIVVAEITAEFRRAVELAVAG